MAGVRGSCTTNVAESQERCSTRLLIMVHCWEAPDKDICPSKPNCEQTASGLKGGCSNALLGGVLAVKAAASTLIIRTIQCAQESV